MNPHAKSEFFCRTFKMTMLAKNVCEKCLFLTTYIPLKGESMTPVNRHTIEFWYRKILFKI